MVFLLLYSDTTDFNHNLKWLNYTVNETRLDHHRPHPIDTKVGIAYSNSMQTHSPIRD